MMLRREFLIGTLSLTALPKSSFAFSDVLIVNRTETCGCCGAWVERMNSAGLRTEVNFVDEQALGLIKTQLGIFAELSSCHTATIGSYFIEGHVPAEDIFKLLTEKPNARGLSVPGMPIGSPGMEMGNNKEPFDTLLVFENGKTQVFNSHAQAPSV
jgi:hypothetical protein